MSNFDDANGIDKILGLIIVGIFTYGISSLLVIGVRKYAWFLILNLGTKLQSTAPH